MKNSPKTANTPSCICNALSQVYTMSENSRMSREFLDDPEIEDTFKYLKRRINVTPMEATILSIIHEHSEDEFTSITNIAKHLNCTTGQVKSLNKVFEKLTSRKLIHYGYYGKTQTLCFFMHRDVLDAFWNNKPYHYKMPTLKSATDLFAALDNCISMRFGRRIGIDELELLIEEILDSGKDLPTVREIISITDGLTTDERKLFLFMVISKYRNNNNVIRLKDYMVLMKESSGITLAYKLKNGESMIGLGLVKVATEDECRPLKCGYSLSETTIERLCLDPKKGKDDDLEDDDLVDEDIDEDRLYSVTSAENIVEKQLYYNASEQQEVENLANLLKQDQYELVQNALKGKGMRGGMNILFYGGPGTGKTESVKQLARLTGRDIMIVDFSQVRSRWVGNSEKNVKKIFDRYRYISEFSPMTPILLLNEADAILGRRIERVSNAVDQSENTIQNILLQEMEDFNGILIATTNLASTLDAAFDRRFLVKIGFKKPEAEVREKIWKSMIPELTKEESETLASTYDIAGGNMENVVRKRIMEEILYQKKVSLERMMELCERETISTNNARRIGF